MRAARNNELGSPGRDKLLAAAADLFVEKGYRATTFIDIASRSDVSRGSISWHFGNKEGLLSAVLEDQFDRLEERIALLEATPSGELADVVGQLVRDGSILRLSRVFVTLYVEALEPAAAAHGQFVDIHDRIRRRLQEWATTAGLVPTTAGSDVAVLLFGAALGVTMQWMLAPERVDPNSITTTLTDLFTQSTGNGGSEPLR